MDNPLRFSKRKEKLPCANQNVTGARTKIQLPIHIYMFKGLDNYKGLVKRLNKARQKIQPRLRWISPNFRAIIMNYF